MLDVILSAIGTIFYPLFAVIFLLIDGVQLLFYAFAGIGNTYFDFQSIANGNSGEENDSGIVYYLLQHSLIKNMLVSMLILALFLIIIFTVFAILKNAYSAKPKNWKEIIVNALKGLGNFIMLPIFVLLGVWLGNIILQAINGATSSGGSTTMARKLFIACAYNANIYRPRHGSNAESDLWTGADDAYEKINKTLTDQHLQDVIKLDKGQDSEYYANKIDEMFSYGGAGSEGFYTEGIYLGSQAIVADYYRLYDINYLILVVAGIFMLYILGSLSFAMVRRIFLILALFIVSPGVCALYPIDEGAAVKTWSGKMKEQVLSGYGAVAGMNIFYSLLPLVEKFQIGGIGLERHAGYFFLNDIIQLFILIVGLYTAKDIISLVTSFTGGEDAYAKGSGLMKNTSKAFADKTKKYAGGTVGAFIKASSAAKESGTKRAFFSSLGKSAISGATSTAKEALKTGTGGIVDWDSITKSIKDSTNQGKQEAQIPQFITKLQSAAQDLANARANFKNNASKNNAEQLQRQINQYEEVLSSFSEDVKSAAITKMSKKSNITVDKMKSEIAQVGNVESKLIDTVMKKDKVTKIDNDIASMMGATDKEDKFKAKFKGTLTDVQYGDGLSDIQAKLNLSNIDDLYLMLKQGIPIDTSNLQNVGALSIAQSFNKTVEENNSDRESFKQATKDLSKAATKFAESQGVADSKISDLKDALKAGDMSRAMSNDIIKAINSQADDNSKNIQKELDSINKINKILSDMKKK